MFFPEKKSALVRLSDTLKIGLDFCADTSRQILVLFAAHEHVFRQAQAIAQQGIRDDVDPHEMENQIREVLAAVPDEVSWKGAYLQSQLHSQALTTILSCCFSLESYINSLAYFLFQETDFLGLIREGNKVSAELLIDAIEQMSTRTKWETVGRLRGGIGFDRSRPPYQDFRILFNFRDDHVHDKVVDFSDDRSSKRYNGMLPDPVTGFLDLGYALYAARTYWTMVSEIHGLIEVDMKSFHRHYNLAPWHDDDHRQKLERIATEYRSKLYPRRPA